MVAPSIGGTGLGSGAKERWLSGGDVSRNCSARRAVIAVARTSLQAAWHVLSKGEKSKERGGDYFDRINSEQTKIKLIRRLERLGFEVELKPKQATV